MNYLQIIKQYKSHIASSYKLITNEQISELPKGKLFVSKKYDGLFCCLVINGKDKKFIMPSGKEVPADTALTKELQKLKIKEDIIIAGELYVAGTETKRERYADVHVALSTKKDTSMCFIAFDVIQSQEENLDTYADKLTYLSKIIKNTKYLSVIQAEELEANKIEANFNKIVEQQQNEGLIIRNDRRIYKMKRNIDLDLVVLGYTLQEKDTVRSISLALALENNQFVHVGSVGTLGTDKQRKELFTAVAKLNCPSPYRLAASDGSLYQLVRPELVVSVIVKDIQNELSDSTPVTHMAFCMQADQLEPLHLTPSVSILNANLSEIRHDKQPTSADCGVQQIERVGFFIKDIKTDVKKQISMMQESSVIEREVYTKSGKNGTAVKKFIILETHKEKFGYPKYLFYFLDLSESRAEPLKRDVRPFSDIKLGKKIMQDYLDKNIKKGWGKYE